MTNFNNPERRDRPVAANQNLSNQELSEGLTQRSAVQDRAGYQDGYWQGRYSERRNQAERRAYEEDSAASGLILGLLLAALAGLGLGTYFFLNEQNRTPVVTPPTIRIPNASPSPSSQVRERIIERDRVVPVPQQAPSMPDVNITVPNPAPESRVTQPAEPTTPNQTTQPETTAPAGNQ